MGCLVIVHGVSSYFTWGFLVIVYGGVELLYMGCLVIVHGVSSYFTWGFLLLCMEVSSYCIWGV